MLVVNVLSGRFGSRDSGIADENVDAAFSVITLAAAASTCFESVTSISMKSVA
jgi:hypothetical protein